MHKLNDNKAHNILQFGYKRIQNKKEILSAKNKTQEEDRLRIETIAGAI